MRHKRLSDVLEDALKNKQWNMMSGAAGDWTVLEYYSEVMEFEGTPIQFHIDRDSWVIEVSNYVGKRMFYGEHHGRMLLNTPLNITRRRLIRDMKIRTNKRICRGEV